jgi:hypothetical protein
MTLSIATPNTVMLYVYAECHLCVLSVSTRPILLSVIVLSAVVLNVVILSVVAPYERVFLDVHLANRWHLTQRHYVQRHRVE